MRPMRSPRSPAGESLSIASWREILFGATSRFHGIGKPMKERMRLSNLLIARGEGSAEQLALFALINLGIIESLSNGILTASDAVRLFYSAV